MALAMTPAASACDELEALNCWIMGKSEAVVVDMELRTGEEGVAYLDSSFVTGGLSKNGAQGVCSLVVSSSGK